MSGSKDPTPWTPIRVHDYNGLPLVELGQTGRGPGAPRRFIPLEDLEALVDPAQVLPPAVFLFHGSRCGSTLVARLLGGSSRHLVVSEAQPVNAVLSRRWGVGEDARRDWVRRMIRALGQRGTPEQRALVVKLTSTNLLEADPILRAFPQTPLVFLYRDPVEAAVSALASPTGWMLSRNGPGYSERLVDCPYDEIRRMTPEEFCARTLGNLYRAAQTLPQRRTLLLNHRSLPAAVWEEIAPRAGLLLTDEDIEGMKIMSTVYSGDPRGLRSYVPDGKEKAARASPLLRDMVRLWAEGSYRELERRRLDAAPR